MRASRFSRKEREAGTGRQALWVAKVGLIVLCESPRGKEKNITERNRTGPIFYCTHSTSPRPVLRQLVSGLCRGRPMQTSESAGKQAFFTFFIVRARSAFA